MLRYKGKLYLKNAEEVVDYIRYEKGYVTFGVSLMNGDTFLLEVPCINN